MKTGPFGKPAMNQRGFMSSIVVQNKMYLKLTGNVGINGVKDLRNSTARCLRCSWLMILPVLVSRAANNEVVPCLR